MDCFENIIIFKEIVITGAATTGAYVAWKGLGEWKRKLTGHFEYDLSKQILVSLYKFREAINGVRNPVIWANEFPYPPKEKAVTMNRTEIDYYATSGVYQARWDKVQEAKALINADLLEAEAIWYFDLKELFKHIYKLEHELYTRIRHYVELCDPNKSEASKEAIRNIDAKNRDVMYGALSDGEEDEFNDDLVAAIGEIEDFLKPKLRHQ